MSKHVTRREALKAGLAMAGIAALGIPEWALPGLAQGEELVPFTDIPENFNTTPGPGRRFLDIRRITDFLTPNDQFFTVQHYGQPAVDPATYQLRINGLVDRPTALSLDDLRSRPQVEELAGFECSGNSRRRIHGLAGNARWAGVRLRTLLDEVGVHAEGKEVVFFGADKGTEKMVHRREDITVDQYFARSLAVENAMQPEVLVAYEMNGEPLSVYQGAPVRLVVPGWYGVSNVKWLTMIHVQDRRFMGRFMARDYVTIRGHEIGGETVWTEHSVSRMQLKSVVARVTRSGGLYKVLGFALTDGTPLRSVEVRIDDGPWSSAVIDRRATRYSWKLFTYMWGGAAPGKHTIVSRAIDADGQVQPLEEDLQMKKTRWENNAQFVRTVRIS